MKKQLDRIDIQILKRLAGDCRLSYRQIAQRLNLSTSTVSKRIKKLQETKIINSFIPLIDVNALNLIMYVIGIKVKPGVSPKDVADLLKSISYISHIFITTGSFDLIVVNVAKDAQDIIKQIKEITSVEGIERYESFQILEVTKEAPVEALISV
ncbi:MAG: Lrp/AsnC family transcriptional regulator [Nitrososphaeria archaeon]